MSNLSQQRTKKIILESFGELLAMKSFSEITMTEIAAKALVHRNTVYKYFNDKYDLLSQGVTFLIYITIISLIEHNVHNYLLHLFYGSVAKFSDKSILV